MTTSREAFLQQVRQAVLAGNRAGHAAPLPARGEVGYQGAGTDLIARFGDGLKAAGGQFYRMTSAEKAVSQVLALVHGVDAKSVAVGQGSWFDGLQIAVRLKSIGIDVWQERAESVASAVKDELFGIDVGVTGADWLIAETGSVVTATRPGQARSLSLLPPVHIVVAHRSQLLADLFDLFGAIPPSVVPACVTLITGPSKTGDIELRLVTGVHGPRELHVIVVDD